MSQEEKFAEAQEKANRLPSRPSNEELLTLYALYKQATSGDVSGNRPGVLDLKGRAKYDAWSQKKGMSREDAMARYSEFVEGLEGKYKKS